MDLNVDILQFLSDEQKKEIGEKLQKKLLEGVNKIDSKKLSTYLINEITEMFQDWETLNELIDVKQIGKAVTKVVKETLVPPKTNNN